METLVVKVLKKYFKMFIKNFKPDQLSVYAAKGEGQMTDLDLNEAVVQELLYIPMNLAVTKATCDLLTLKIPWTSLNSKPVTLTLNRIDIDLREPETIQPPHDALKKLAEKKKKANSRSDIMDNAQLVINNVHITVQTLGGSLVMIDLEDIVVQSTNGQWQVVDLNQSRVVDKEQGIETLYKKLTVRSITLALLTERSAHAILQQMPLKIHLTQKRRIKDIALLGAEIEFVLEDVKFRWTRPEYLLMVELGRGFQVCLSRPVPEPTTPSPLPSPSSGDKAGPPPEPDFSIAFKVRLDKWTIDFIESADKSGEKGYSFFGHSLVTIFNSAKTSVQRIANEKTGETNAQEVEETLISVNISTVNFRELMARSHVHPFIVSSKDHVANSPAPVGQHLLKGNFVLRRPTVKDPTAKYVPLLGLELSVHLSNLQLVAERKVWKGLIKFLSVPPLPTDEKKEKEKPEEPEEDVITAAQNSLNKFKETLKLGEDWASQVKLNIRASDLRLILPQERKGIYTNVALHIDLGNIVMGNFSDWKVTPNLQKGIGILAAPSPAPPVSQPKTVGVPQKLTFQIEGVGIAVHTSGRVANILAPTGVKLFVHYYERESKGSEKGRPNLEVIFQSGEFNLQANEQQFKYLAFLGKKYLDPRKIKAALTQQVDAATAVATAKIKQELDEFTKDLPKEDLVTPIKEKVQSTLDAYKWIVYIHFNKGVFRVPLQFLLAPDAPETPAAAAPAVEEKKAAVVSNPLMDFGEEEEKKKEESGPSFEDLLGRVSADLCEVRYEGMDLAFENNANGQGVVIQLGSFQATGLDHPSLPSVITLLPLKISAEEKARNLEDIESLVFRYKRRRKNPTTSDEPAGPNEDYTTDVWFRLQGMQVKVSSKPNHPGIQIGMGLPDIKAMVDKAVALLQEKQADIDLLRENAKKIDTNDVKWGVELGNCEVLLEEIEKGTNVYKPYGQVRLADAQRQSITKAYFDLESQLVRAKTSLLMFENEKEDLNAKVNKLTAALTALETEKTSLETRFAQAKVAIAQHQMENDNLQTQINRLSKR